MANSHLATFLNYLKSDKTEFQIAQRSYFIVSFGFPNGKPNFENSLPKYYRGNEKNPSIFNSEYLTYLVQTIDLPKLSIAGGASNGEGYSIVNFEGQAKGPGKFVVLPDGAKSVEIKFLDTEMPVFENYFYPWMNEVAAFQYRGGKHPFARATIYVDLLSNDLKRITQTYRILGAYPHSIDLPELKQAASQTPTRTVTFDFNNLQLSDLNGYTFNNNNILPDEFVTHVCNEIDRISYLNAYLNVPPKPVAGNQHTKDVFSYVKNIKNIKSDNSSSYYI